MRSTSDRRRDHNRGRPLPDLPWLGNRLSDEIIAPGPSPVPITPDLVVSREYGLRRGLVTRADIAAQCGINVRLVDGWIRQGSWPPRRAMMQGPSLGPPAYAYWSVDVRAWLSWAAADPPHKLTGGTG